ncbi:MAG: glycosyltransferase family 1 protein [Firmicutes bacterium HGW-Firmicutes-7]|nr:MAG: glycosyltransferase family 1 protein [Firmicutes bacterium HGW-Firmicutes-7]
MKAIHMISGGDTGGAKTSVITLLTGLQKLMTIKLICFVDAEFADFAREMLIDVVVLQQKSRVDLSVLSEITRIIHEEQFDVVNCHGARANFLGAFLKKKINIPMITTVHSDYTHDFDNSLYKKFVFTSLNRISLMKMDGYITMAEKLKSDLIHKGFRKESIFVIYNGIPMTAPSHVIPKEEFLENYEVPYSGNNFYVGTASRLHPIKGIDVLLKAAKIVKTKNQKIKFLIAGNGDEKYENKYKNYVKDHDLEDTVYFLGFVTEMDSFYQLLDINTITSHSEGLCYALLEGGKYSKPSIASRVGGIPELIQHEKSGLLFEDNDIEVLVKYIMKIYSDKSFSRELGDGLYTRIEEGFSDIAMANRYQEVYKKILER